MNRRAAQILNSLWSDPQASINAASQGWAETQAAYRFLGNDNVHAEEILRPHREATLGRMAQHEVVLIAPATADLRQDTTELDYTPHAPQGAGPLTSEKRQGFLDHSHVAFTPEGLCLGVLEAKIWARSDEGFGQSQKRKYDPLETKETFRWLEGYRHACEAARQTPGTQIISVSDREGDLYELFVEADVQAAAGRAADYVVRAGKNRSLAEPTPGNDACYEKLQQTMTAAPRLGTRDLELTSTPQRKARTARVEIRAQRLTLKAPCRKGTKLPEVAVNVVLVREMDPPPDVEPVEWLLITSLPIDTLEQVLQVVDYYRGRWGIEVFFRVFKSGCRVEEIQLETAPRLRRCLMFYKIIAWRVMCLTILGRACPDLPCDVMFTADEWMPVWTITRDDEPIPATPPDLATFLRLLGELGGHNGRRCDGPPGPQALWIGIRRMTDFALAWRAFGPKHHRHHETHDTCV